MGKTLFLWMHFVRQRNSCDGCLMVTGMFSSDANNDVSKFLEHGMEHREAWSY